MEALDNGELLDQYQYEEDDDNDEEEGDLEDIHNRLLASIYRFSGSCGAETEADGQNDAGQRIAISTDSIYDSDLSNEASVSMNALLNSLDQSSDLNSVKKKLKDFEKIAFAPKFTEKVISDRAERSLTYDGTKKEMDKWQETIVTNRNAKTLDLAQDKRQLPSYKNVIRSHIPTTDMEKEIQMISVRHKTSENLSAEAEIDELQSGNLSAKEIRERQAELAKIKALMFYEQMKRHRLNKIKSKAYHRIRKKQKDRLRARSSGGDEGDDDAHGTDDDLEGALDGDSEKLAFERVKERMSLRHKNTSKWARMALEHSKGDKSLRIAYHDSVQLGHEISQKINASSAAADSDGGEEVSDDEDDGSGRVSVKTARLLQKTVVEGEAPIVDGRYKKLLGMDFMRKATEKKKEKAREEASTLLRELMEIEAEEYGDEEIDEGDAISKNNRGNVADKAMNALAAKKKIDELFDPATCAQGGSGMLLLARQRSKTSAISSSDYTSTPISKNLWSEPVLLSSNDEMAASDATMNTEAAVVDRLYNNPWLKAPSQSENSNDRATGAGDTRGGVVHKARARKSHGRVDKRPEAAGAAVGIITAEPRTTTRHAAACANVSTRDQSSIDASLEGAVQSKKSQSTSKVLPERKPLLIQKSQADLVQMAFAGPDLEAEFEALKKAAVDEELGINEKRLKIVSDVKAGWGDWAGPGASGINQKTLNKRDRLLKAAEEDAIRKKANRQDSSSKMYNVVLSEKRVKSAAKFKLADVPHPFSTREEYERSIQMPIGEEWNASHVVRTNTKPEILTRAGRVLEPAKLSKKRTYNASSAADGITTAARVSKKTRK